MTKTTENLYLTGRQVRDRYSITKVTLHRWMNRESLNFPQPMRVGTRLFFRLDDIVAWERAGASRSARIPAKAGEEAAAA